MPTLSKSAGKIIKASTIFVLSYGCICVRAQVTNNTQIQKADKVIVYNTVNDNNKDKILQINKYLDTSKLVTVNVGTMSNTIKFSNIPKTAQRRGFTPMNIYGHKILDFTFEKGQLLINGDLYNFEGKVVAKIRDNKLIHLENRPLQQKATDRWFEIIDDNNIPVLQVELNVKTNSIDMTGLTFDQNGTVAVILTLDPPSQMLTFPPYLQMLPRERDSIWFEIKRIAKSRLKEKH